MKLCNLLIWAAVINMRVFYKDFEFVVHDQVYEPREDSFLLADSFSNVSGTVLDLGSGCGIQGILAAKRGAEKVVSVDLNPAAVENTKENAELLEVSDKLEARKSDLFENVLEKFDLILFNAPYLPKSEEHVEQPIDLSYNSTETVQRFLKEYEAHLNPRGYALVVMSSISDVEVPGEVIATKKVAFEALRVVRTAYSR